MKASAALLSLLLTTPVCEHPVKTWDFESDVAGKTPERFYFDTTRETTDGKWEIVRDGDSNVLAQVDRNRSESRFALAVVRDASYEDLRLSVRLKAVEGEVDQTGGIIWRYRNSENYYLLRADVSEKKIRLYRVVNGNRIQFAQEENVRHFPDTWDLLKVEHDGERMKVYLDDEMLFKAKDQTFQEKGKIGLWTQADAVTHFDDLRVESLDDDDEDDDH
jgi:hypothetical protein